MARKYRQEEKKYLITNAYRVLVMFIKNIFQYIRWRPKDKAQEDFSCNPESKSDDNFETEHEPALVVKTVKPLHKDAKEVSVNYNVYFLPSPQKKIPVLKDASDELLRTSMFLTEYHKYLQKEFLEFAHG